MVAEDGICPGIHAGVYNVLLEWSGYFRVDLLQLTTNSLDLLCVGPLLLYDLHLTSNKCSKCVNCRVQER